MTNLTTVSFSSGTLANTVTGTVSTIDNMLSAAGTPSSNVLTVQPSSVNFTTVVSSLSNITIASISSGTVIVSSQSNITIASISSGTVTAAISSGVINIASISSGSVTAVISSGTVTVASVSSGTLTSLSSGTVAIANGANVAAVKASATAPSSTDPALVVAISPNGLNPNGIALSSNAAPMTLASNQPTIACAQDVTQLSNGLSGVYVTPATAVISASAAGNTTIVSTTTLGSSSLHVRVLQWIVVTSTAVNFQFLNGTSSTALTGLFTSGGPGGGAGGSYAPVGHFTANVGEALNINLSGAVPVGGYLKYVLV